LNTFPDFEIFRSAWLEDVIAGNPSTTVLGNRFAQKIVTQWLEVDDESDGFVFCDGAGDGGIDIAYLDRSDTRDSEEDANPVGNTWYLVQSKYGKAFKGVGTLLAEGQKVAETLDGQRTNLSSLAQGLVERLHNFQAGASENDKIVLVFATEAPLDEAQKRALIDVRTIARQRLPSPPIFETDSVSIETIRQRLIEQAQRNQERSIELRTHAAPSGENLLVGATSLLDLYDFLRRYRDETGDLDQLYEKNVRRFLGNKGKVNKEMQKTLKNMPDRFGLYMELPRFGGQ